MLKRVLSIAIFAGLLFAGTGTARFVHLRSAHAGDSIAEVAKSGHSHCHHHHAPAADDPIPPPDSEEDCPTCFLIAATLKGVAPVLSIVPTVEPPVVERTDIPRATIVAHARLDAASQRGPPALPA